MRCHAKRARIRAEKLSPVFCGKYIPTSFDKAQLPEGMLIRFVPTCLGNIQQEDKS